MKKLCIAILFSLSLTWASTAAAGELRYHEGVRHLAERDWVRAAEAFAAAASFEPVRRDAFRYRVYALCRADRCGEAADLAQTRYARVASNQPLPHFWVWMRDAFGVDPRSRKMLSKR